jgi:hypothetical protein
MYDSGRDITKISCVNALGPFVASPERFGCSNVFRSTRQSRARYKLSSVSVCIITFATLMWASHIRMFFLFEFAILPAPTIMHTAKDANLTITFWDWGNFEKFLDFHETLVDLWSLEFVGTAATFSLLRHQRKILDESQTFLLINDFRRKFCKEMSHKLTIFNIWQ